MTWLHNLISKMPPKTEHFVICENVQNLDQFPINNILISHSIYNLFLKKIFRKFGIRHDRFLKNAILEYKPNVLHSHFGNAGWFNAKVATNSNIKHIVTFYGLDVNRLPVINPIWKSRYVDLFQSADKILCEGPYMADCIQKLGCPTSKILIHRIGVDLDRIPFVERVLSKKERLRFLIVGAFRQKKGIPFALEALGRLKKDFDHFDITIIGDAIHPDELEEKHHILNTLSQWGLMNQTTMLGFQHYDQTLSRLYDHHIFLSPSIIADDGDTEGGAPVTIIEAAASGMPVISTRHCDIPNVLARPNVDLLAEERDVNGLIHAIERLLGMEWHHLVVENRLFIEKHHHPYTLSNQLENLYCSL